MQKLRICQELMLEVVAEVSVTELADEAHVLMQFFAHFIGKRGDILTVLTGKSLSPLTWWLLIWPFITLPY